MSRVFVVAMAAGAALLGAQASAIPLNNLALDCQVASQMGRHDPATLRLCNQAVRTEGLTDAQRAATHLNRGVVHINRGSERLAIEDFQEAIRLEPTLGDAHINLGLAQLAQGMGSEAVQSLTLGINNNPREPAKAYYGRGLAYESLGRVAEARADFEQAVALAPRWSEARRDLARLASQ